MVMAHASGRHMFVVCEFKVTARGKVECLEKCERRVFRTKRLGPGEWDVKMHLVRDRVNFGCARKVMVRLRGMQLRRVQMQGRNSERGWVKMWKRVKKREHGDFSFPLFCVVKCYGLCVFSLLVNCHCCFRY